MAPITPMTPMSPTVQRERRDLGDLGDLGDLVLVDHHCHGVVTRDLSLPQVELLSTEASEPGPAGTTFFDSQLGLSLRRWCPPVLGLAPNAEPAEYVARRRQLGAAEVTRLLLRAAAVADLLVDTGYQPAELGPAEQGGPAGLAAAAGARVHTVVRLERVAEELAATGAGPGNSSPATRACSPGRHPAPSRSSPSSLTGMASTSIRRGPVTQRSAARRTVGWVRPPVRGGPDPGGRAVPDHLARAAAVPAVVGDRSRPANPDPHWLRGSRSGPPSLQSPADDRFHPRDRDQPGCR